MGIRGIAPRPLVYKTSILTVEIYSLESNTGFEPVQFGLENQRTTIMLVGQISVRGIEHPEPI